MPKLKMLHDPKRVSKLIQQYIKIERKSSVDSTASRIGMSKQTLYNRIEDPDSLKLREVRRIGQALGIPPEELLDAVSAALRYMYVRKDEA